jgi:hypothetical protein
MLKVERRDEAMDPQGYGVLIVPTSCKPWNKSDSLYKNE